MKRIKNTRLWALSSASILLLLGAGVCTSPAQAAAPQSQSSSVSKDGIEEVTVTALRRKLPIQKTPASIAVLDSAQIDAAGVTSLNDVAKLVPNLDFKTNFRAGVPYISMRGVPTAQGGEAPVAVLIDGAQAPGLDFVNVDIVDISSVEVLRGPQGALYGRGAIAGAVLINTTKPTNDFYDKAVLDYGNGNTFRIINTMSGPIVKDRLWMKATYQYKSSDGLIYDHGLHAPGDWYKEHLGRIELLAKPTSTTTIDLKASYLGGVDGGAYFDIVPNGGTYDFQHYFPNRNLNTQDHRTVSHYVAKIDQETPIGTITSISQYAEAISRFMGDADWTPAPIAEQYNRVQVRAFNQDLRLSSPSDQSFEWLIGGFFQYRDTVNYLDVFAQNSPSTTFITSDENQKSVAYAVYGQANIDLPYDMKLSGALRYDVDERYDNARNTPNSAIRATFSSVQPSATLSKQFAPDLMGYVTVGKGFRSGGFNAYQDTLNFAALVKRKFPEETVQNYEAGVKSQLLDRRLTINASVFHADYKNEQYYFINISPPSRDIITIGSVGINGGELEVAYNPIPPLTLSASLGVAVSRINSNDGPFLNDYGKHSPNANTYNSNIAIQYNVPLWDNWTGTARLAYQRLGSIYYDPANNFSFHPTNYLNARIGLITDHLSLTFWGKNLTDTRAPTIFSPSAFGPGLNSRQDNLPRSFGIEVSTEL